MNRATNEWFSLASDFIEQELTMSNEFLATDQMIRLKMRTKLSVINRY